LPTNEDGEFELILGNRQLLSVFFIVVILLGVFFTMGYIVGRNSTPVAVAESNPPRKGDTKPLIVDSPAPRETSPSETSSPAPRESSSSAPITTAQQQPAETPKAAKTEPVKAPPVKSEPAKSEPAKSEPAKSAKAEKEKTAKPAPAPAPAPASTGAPSGTYLQLAATTKREADIMVDVLRQKKFSAITAQVPEKPDLFRVLVGPMSEAQVNKTKTDLQSAGFPGDKSIKRSF
jgi:cell division septation protein DedD